MDNIILVTLCIILLLVNIRLYIYSINLSNIKLETKKEVSYDSFAPTYVQTIVLSITSPTTDKYILELANYSVLSNYIQKGAIDTLAYNGHLFKVENMKGNMLSLRLIGIKKEYSVLNTGNVVHNAIMLGFSSFYVS